jgi:hypothetical protein
MVHAEGRFDRFMLLKFLIMVLLASPGLAGPALVPVRLFGDHMVLPMGRVVPVWGGAEPGAAVEVRFGTISVRKAADARGNRRVSEAIGSVVRMRSFGNRRPSSLLSPASLRVRMFRLQDGSGWCLIWAC